MWGQRVQSLGLCRCLPPEMLRGDVFQGNRTAYTLGPTGWDSSKSEWLALILCTGSHSVS